MLACLTALTVGMEMSKKIRRDAEAGSEESEPEEFQVRTSLLEERRLTSQRSAGITRINQQLAQVNSMFRDLSSIVIAQGESISTIEGNSDMSYQNTEVIKSQLKITKDGRQQLKDMITILACLIVFVFGISIYRSSR